MMISSWENLLSYHSIETVQKRLETKYKNNSFTNPSSLAYENCSRFVYFLKHGENFFNQANKAPTSLQPMLLFYGLSQLLKACLLISDPLYPETSTVLAHGVSSRKRKKQNYHFLKDEVKIQRNGFFSHIATKMFDIKNVEADKYSMEELFKQLAEMNDLFHFHHSKVTHTSVDINKDFIIIPHHVADLFHMTSNRLAEFLMERCSFLSLGHINEKGIHLILEQSIQPFNSIPFMYHLQEDKYYISTSRDFSNYIPELLIHYLLLYNLSMISRYETEWWYDLLLSMSSNDYPFILKYLEICKRKIPHYIWKYIDSVIS
ncbi:YaaC family protein [Metabacillus fastidiosus]|uniref:YaaC family protein n=1 Tax=Metabacillus fastidiosus TaxID=1458 RepID=UPI003D27BAE2